MWYMGGKFRQSKAITAELVRRYNGEKTYVEPFCGAMGSAEKAIPTLAKLGVEKFVLSDVNPALIDMWKAAIDGWEPPDFISQEVYDEYKTKYKHAPIIDGDPMIAYCGYAMSFGGKWYGGLARSGCGTERTQLNQKVAVVRKASVLRNHGVKVYCRSFNVTPWEGALIYCDPPYASRTKAYRFGAFDPNEFWLWAEQLSKKNNVIVTEFNAPKGWCVVHSWGDTVVRHIKKFVTDGTNECIFEFVGEDA